MSVDIDNVTLHLRKMSEDDLDIVYANEVAAYPQHWTMGVLKDCLTSSYLCLVCELEDIIIGHCFMSIAVGEAHILNICIHPDHQGKGLGRIFLRRMFRIARDSQADTMFLEVRVSNLPAIKLYESEGFCELGTRRNYYPANSGKREDALMYAKPLVV